MSEAAFPIVIRLAGEPEGKGRPRFARATGRAFTPAATRAYEAALRYAAQTAMNGRPPVDGPLAVTLTAFMPVPASWSKKKQAAALDGELWPVGKPDADNLLKTIDALNEVVWRDDKQAVIATVVKTYSARPELRIVVRLAERQVPA